MNFIVNPNTFEKYSLFSRKGTSLLKNYVKLYQSGGADGGGGGGAAATDTLQSRIGGVEVEGRRKVGQPCPIYKYTDEDGNDVSKYLAIHDYNEIEAEKVGYNPLLINEEIKGFLLNQGETTIMTWVMLVNPQPSNNNTPIGKRDTKKLFKLVAVHNESYYEFSAKHDTIITRILSNEKGKFPNIGPNFYFASGELMFIPSEGLYYNFQSGTYYTNKIEPQGNIYNVEATKQVGPGFWLKSLLDPNEEFGKFKYVEDTFINNKSYISPKYIEKLEKLKNKGLVKYTLFKESEKSKCIDFTRQNLIKIAINHYTRMLENLKGILKSKRGKAMYETFEKIYGTQIKNFERLRKIEIEKLKAIGVHNDNDDDAAAAGRVLKKQKKEVKKNK